MRRAGCAGEAPDEPPVQAAPAPVLVRRSWREHVFAAPQSACAALLKLLDGTQ